MNIRTQLCLLLSFASPSAFAQQASIRGTVTDPSNAAVVGAEIQAINQDTSAIVKVKTGSGGVFSFSGLTPARYQITVTAKAFATDVSVDLIESADQVIKQDIHLRVDSVDSTVRVQANPDLVDLILPPTTVDLGPAGAQKPLDSPYQTSVISQKIIHSQNLRDAAGFLQYDPSAQMSRSGNSGRPFTRGFESGVVENSRIDGMNVIITTGYPAEQFDRLEILEGVAGALYGPANPTGTFNYVLKRPTIKTRQTIGYGYDSLGVSTVYGDLGATVGKVASRLNLVYGDGQSYTSSSDYKRFLASGSVDVHFNPATTLQLNASYYNWQALGFPATFAYGSGQSTLLPSAPDAARTGFGVKGAGYRNYTTTLSGRILHDFGPNWHLNGGVLNQVVERGISQPTFTMTDNSGNYKATIAKSGASRFTILSNAVYLNGNVYTRRIKHDIFLGSNGFSWDSYSASGQNITLGTGSLSNPTIFAAQSRPSGQAAYVTSNVYQQALVFGDTLTFNKYWSLSLNSSFSWLTTTNYSAAGKTTSQKAVDGYWSPTASLLFRPARNQSAYFTFSNSIIQGDTAPTTASNSGQTLAPYLSKQFEAGYKYAVTERLLLSAAGFRINKPFSSTDSNNVYRAQGMEVNWGASFMATGEVTRDLSVIGGFQYLVPTLTATGVAATQGKDVVNVPHFQSNALLEYKVPHVIGLAVSANLHATGRRAANDRNTTYADSYFTSDIGASYVLPLARDKHPFTARFEIYNVGNASYWQSIYPTSGTSLVGSSAVLGTPRIVSCSLDYKF